MQEPASVVFSVANLAVHAVHLPLLVQHVRKFARM